MVITNELILCMVFYNNQTKYNYSTKRIEHFITLCYFNSFPSVNTMIIC